ncbi:MAG TPA: hypothetical protein VLS90_13050, partial [Thermodesulfobacteriota bacterium]|nr:hypothetical protein [Thermodesulfobacteriota bacterium]
DYREGGETRSRLDIAKSNLLALLEALPPESRFGLGVFAGTYESVLILTPPSSLAKSRAELKPMIRSIDRSWTWDDGTDLFQSIYSFGKILEKSRDSFGEQVTAIFLTDGENSPAFIAHPSLDPRVFSGVQFFFAGHGTTEGAKVPEFDEAWKLKGYRMGAGGEPLVSRMDEENLKNLARLLEGEYLRVDSGSALKSLTLKGALKKGRYETSVHLDWAFWVGSFAFICLFLIL